MTRKGTTIIELIVALGIIITGLLVVVGLIARSISVGTRAKNELLALTLAQEGIESVRAIRDSNSLEEAGTAWDLGLEGNSGDYTLIPLQDYNYDASPENFISGIWKIDYSPNDISESDTRVYRYLDSSTTSPGMYYQRIGGADAESATTVFSRIVSIEPLCDDLPDPKALSDREPATDSCETVAPVGSLKKVGIHIVSTVAWPEGRTPQIVELTQDIYDWR